MTDLNLNTMGSQSSATKMMSLANCNLKYNDK